MIAADPAEQMNHPTTNETTLNAYPNPTKGSTTVEFISMSSGWVVLRLFDHLGQQVSVLYEGDVEQGIQYRLLFDGAGMSPGIYLFALQSDEEVITKTLMLSR